MNRRLLLPTLGILSGFAVTLAAVELVLRFLPVNEGPLQQPVNADMPVISFYPDRDFTWSHGWNFSIIAHKHANNFGFFNDQDYVRSAATPLLAIIGDSYVEAIQVDNAQTLHGRLGRQLGKRGRIYGFGASGAPLSTYLAYARYTRKEFSPDSMVFVIVGNDFDESLPKYMRLPGHHYFVAGDDKQFRLQRVDYAINPIKRILRNSALMRYLAYNTRFNWRSIEARLFHPPETVQTFVGNTLADATPERIADSSRAIDAFLDLLPEMSGLDASRIAFVVDGMRPEIYSAEGRRAMVGSYFDRMRGYFFKQAGARGYEVLDMQPRFLSRYKATGIRFEFTTDNHWNAEGHELVAKVIGASRLFRRTFGIPDPRRGMSSSEVIVPDRENSPR